MVCVSASVNLPLHHKVQKSSGTGSPGWSRKKGRKTVVWCGVVCSCQTAGWIKMPHGTEVGLGPGRIMLDGDHTSSCYTKGHSSPPLFGPCLLWPNDRPSVFTATAELMLKLKCVQEKASKLIS